MKSLIATLIFLHSACALSSEPNTKARFFETIAKHLATQNFQHWGLHPHEGAPRSRHSQIFRDAIREYYQQSIYRRDAVYSHYVSTTYPSTGNLIDIRINYGRSTGIEFQIVPGVFVKSGLNIVKMFQASENEFLYISYGDNAQKLIQNMILAASLNWETVRLPLLAYLFDKDSLLPMLPRELMHIIGSKSYFGSAEIMELYTDLYR